MSRNRSVLLPMGYETWEIAYSRDERQVTCLTSGPASYLWGFETRERAERLSPWPGVPHAIGLANGALSSGSAGA